MVRNLCTTQSLKTTTYCEKEQRWPTWKLPVNQQLFTAQHCAAKQELLGSWGDKRHCLSEMHNLELGIQSKTEKEQDASNLLLFLPVNLVLKIFAWGRRKKGRFRGCQLKNSNQIHTCIRRQINCFDAAPRLSLQFTGEDKANRLSH